MGGGERTDLPDLSRNPAKSPGWSVSAGVWTQECPTPESSDTFPGSRPALAPGSPSVILMLVAPRLLWTPEVPGVMRILSSVQAA